MRRTFPLFSCAFALLAFDANAGEDLLAVEPDNLGLLWKLEKTHFEVRGSDAENQSVLGGCVTATLIIEADGRTSDVRLVRSVPEGAWKVSAERVFKAMRFEPTARNTAPEATYSAMTVTFAALAGHQKQVGTNMRMQPPAPEELRERCRIERLM